MGVLLSSGVFCLHGEDAGEEFSDSRQESFLCERIHLISEKNKKNTPDMHQRRGMCDATLIDPKTSDVWSHLCARSLDRVWCKPRGKESSRPKKAVPRFAVSNDSPLVARTDADFGGSLRLVGFSRGVLFRVFLSQSFHLLSRPKQDACFPPCGGIICWQANNWSTNKANAKVVNLIYMS